MKFYILLIFTINFSYQTDLELVKISIPYENLENTCCFFYLTFFSNSGTIEINNISSFNFYTPYDCNILAEAISFETKEFLTEGNYITIQYRIDSNKLIIPSHFNTDTYTINNWCFTDTYQLNDNNQFYDDKHIILIKDKNKNGDNPKYNN